MNKKNKAGHHLLSKHIIKLLQLKDHGVGKETNKKPNTLTNGIEQRAQKLTLPSTDFQQSCQECAIRKGRS